MPHEVSYDAAARVLRVRYRGEIALEERERAIREACELAEEVRCRHILLDFREAHSIEGDPAAGVRIADTWASRFVGARVAYLVINDHQVNDLVERLARDRGVTMMRFRDRDLAMEWLREADAANDAASGTEAAAVPAEGPTAAACARDIDRLVDQALDPAIPIAPATYAAIGQLVQELLDAGIGEAEVVGVARRMAAAIKASSAR